MKTQQQGWRAALLFLLLLCFAFAQVFADPSGATISGPTTVSGPNITPSARSDAKGTITTMVLNSIGQTGRWKAYVGNVTGSLVLENPNNFSIYSWDLPTMTGEVYASRYGNLTWTSVSCAPQGLIQNESAYYGMTNANPDRINATFNWTVHKTFTVGVTPIANSTCNSTVTYINSARQTPTENSPFQEVLVRDANGYMVYMADISDDTVGYDNTTYDFQIIVPELNNGTTTSYYFYTELG